MKYSDQGGWGPAPITPYYNGVKPGMKAQTASESGLNRQQQWQRNRSSTTLGIQIVEHSYGSIGGRFKNIVLVGTHTVKYVTRPQVKALIKLS